MKPRRGKRLSHCILVKVIVYICTTSCMQIHNNFNSLFVEAIHEDELCFQTNVKIELIQMCHYIKKNWSHTIFCVPFLQYKTEMIQQPPCRTVTYSNTYRIKHELPWITIFESRVRWFAKSLENLLTRDPKIVIHGSEYTISFLTRYFMSWTHNSA